MSFFATYCIIILGEMDLLCNLSGKLWNFKLVFVVYISGTYTTFLLRTIVYFGVMEGRGQTKNNSTEIEEFCFSLQWRNQITFVIVEVIIIMMFTLSKITHS